MSSILQSEHLAGGRIIRPLRVIVGGLGKLGDELSGVVCEDVKGLCGEGDSAGRVSSAEGDREVTGAGDIIDEELSEDLGGVGDRLAEDFGVKYGGAVGDNELGSSLSGRVGAGRS